MLGYVGPGGAAPGRLPRWVLAGKEALPHVAGMRSSLRTAPPFHMRSNPPTLVSSPVSLHGRTRIQTNPKQKRRAPDDPGDLYLRSTSTTFKVSSNSRNFIS